MIWRDTIDLTRDPAEGLFGLLGIAGLLAATSGSPRFGYMPTNPALPGAREFATASGAEHLPELDLRLGEETIECHVISWGEGGVVAALREHLYRELGLPVPPPLSPREAVSVEQVREAFAASASRSRSPAAPSPAATASRSAPPR